MSVHTIEYWADANFFNVQRVTEFAKRPENDQFIIVENGKILVSTWWSNDLAKAYKESIPHDVWAKERQESFERQRKMLFGENV